MTTAIAATGVGTATASRAGVEIRLENLRRRYGAVTALDGLSLTLAPGELVALLGPSGCGKTTALRLLAGLEEADGGRVVIGGHDVTGLPANKRDTGMVFQAYSLFPHMTAWENVAFGLQMRKIGAADRRRRAVETLELVGLAGFANRYAHQMSGGQQQRVALARALAIADRVGVMQSGRLEQIGPPTAIYGRPATPFVAEFVGLTNRLAGVVRGGSVEVRGTRIPLVQPDVPDGPAVALIRPEAVTLTSGADTSAGPLVGTVIATAFLGATSRVTVDLGDVRVLAQLATSDAASAPAGTRVQLTLRADPVLIARETSGATPA